MFGHAPYNILYRIGWVYDKVQAFEDPCYYETCLQLVVAFYLCPSHISRNISRPGRMEWDLVLCCQEDSKGRRKEYFQQNDANNKKACSRGEDKSFIVLLGFSGLFIILIMLLINKRRILLGEGFFCNLPVSLW